MKLLFFINQFYKGGAETNLLNLLRALSPEEHEVDLLVYDQLELPDVVSLLPLVPDWVNVCDAAKNEGAVAFLKKAVHRVVRDVTHRQPYRAACYEFVRGKRYDAAISYGEWFAPQFVAESVSADRKLVWIHSDIDKAQFFRPELMFRYDERIDMYLFASRRSMAGALERYPQLRGRAAVVSNICDDEGVRAAARQPAPETAAWKHPVVLTVANFRAEKNHLRQVEAMRLLKEQGFDLTWVNVGADTDTALIARIDQAVRRAGLEGRFIRMGARPSPYNLMKAADAVAVLSDFESWSMVITEAKLLGVPVIATRTSGALEQLEDGVTGILCDFTAEDIAEQLRRLLGDEALRGQIRENLAGFATQGRVIREFEAALAACKRRPKLLYVSDNINYVSGVQRVTATQIEALKDRFDIALFSMTAPDEHSLALFSSVPIYDMGEYGTVGCLAYPCAQVLRGREFSLTQKAVRLFYAAARHLGKGGEAVRLLTDKKLRRLFDRFDTVCVLSEASQMRAFVAKLRGPRKIQWIHTDYALWSEYTDWTRMVTEKDGETYKSFDRIVCLTQVSRDGFVKKHPHLADKTVVIANLQPVEDILRRAREPLELPGFDPDAFNIVSVGRMDTEKAVDRILRIAARLRDEGAAFRWYFIGDGPLRAQWEQMCADLSLDGRVTFLGAKDNPYPYIAHASLFALLSRYEGLPVTIDEAKILGVPVFATRVGGIVEQVEDGVTGILTESDEQAIYECLRALLLAPQRLEACRRALRERPFESEQIVRQLERLFGAAQVESE